MGHPGMQSIDETDKKEEDKRTVFVRGLDVSVDDDLLTETFSSIGPVKHGFTVKKKVDGVSLDKHKGFGFVQFALEEDAVRAVQELNGTKLAGRVIKLESAHKRASFEERKNKKKKTLRDEDENGDETKKEAKPMEKRRKQIDVEQNTKKHNLVKSVAIGGLGPHDVDGAIEYAKKLGTVEDVVHPLPTYIMRQFHLEQDGCSGSVVLVQYETVKQALKAVKSLHGKQKKFSPGKKAVPVRLWARQISGDGKHLKKHRVVVRNLPFNVTEKDLRAAFGDLTIWEVTIPRNADGNSRGFAFVGFITKTDTEKAIARVNATDIAGRTVAVDWAVSKREFESKDTADKAKAKPIEKETESNIIQGIKPGEEFEFEEEEDINPEKEKAIMNTVLDGILSSKDKNDSGSSSGEESDDETYEEVEEDNSGSSSENSEGEDSQERDEEETKRNREDVVNRVNQKAEELQQALTAEKEKYFVEPGATVFIRNIPVDATQKTVFHAMKKFGFVKSTRLVLNKSTKKPKGTAFVDFKTVESANQASEASQKAIAKKGPQVMIAGKPVEIHIALGGDEIRDLAVRKSNDLGEVKGKPDSEKGRNLYLAQEGLILEGSAAWNQLSNSDKAKRARGAEDSSLKLKSPNFAVSKTRLNVRNVPKSWDETRLKQLFVKAVRTRATKETPKVVQVKILREPQGVSKGIAFIEFKAHDHALCALRELNNNPETWGKDHRPIIEFAIDNVQALKKRETNLLRQKAALENGGTLTSTKKSKKKSKEPKEETKSKRKLKMERRQMLKQRTRSMQGKEQKEDTAQMTKSQRRREQRKKQKDDQMVDVLASAGVDQGRQVSKKKRSAVSDSVEGMVEKKIRKTTNNKRPAPEKRWFDK